MPLLSVPTTIEVSRQDLEALMKAFFSQKYKVPRESISFKWYVFPAEVRVTITLPHKE